VQLTVHMTSTKSKIWVSGKCIGSERPKSVAMSVSSVEDLIGRESVEGEVPSVTVTWTTTVALKGVIVYVPYGMY
jgi:hypothetical protein